MISSDKPLLGDEGMGRAGPQEARVGGAQIRGSVKKVDRR